MTSFPNGGTLTAEKIAAYAVVLQGISPEIISKGCMTLARTCKFFPSAAEVREACQAEWRAFDLEQERRQIFAWQKEIEAGKECGEVVAIAQIHEHPAFQAAVEHVSLNHERHHVERVNMLKQQAQKLKSGTK